MKRRPYNPQFARPFKSRRQREDDAFERDMQIATRNARVIEVQEACSRSAGPKVANDQANDGGKQNG